MDAHALAQRLRAVQGRDFEDVVATILNAFLAPDIAVVRGKYKNLQAVIDNQSSVDRIVNYLRLPVKRRCTQDQIEDYPDSDLVALVPPPEEQGVWRDLAIINCKVSFHARHTEVCFWGAEIRSSSYIKYVCVTEDRDIYSRGGRSELGASCDHPTAARRLLECFTDRIYLVRRYSAPDDPQLQIDVHTKRDRMEHSDPAVTFDDPARPRHTKYCHLVRPIDDLIQDLRRWSLDIPPS